MNKLAIVAVLTVITIGALLLTKGSDSGSRTAPDSGSGSGVATSSNGGTSGASGGTVLSTKQGDSADLEQTNGQDGAQLQQPDRPATEVYRNAEDALRAVKEGATHYDDVILEQFESLPADCSWCANFYESIRTLAFSPDTPADQKSYFAEILAISARSENLEVLIDGIEKAPNEEAGQMYAEALEMASATNDDLVKLLGSRLSTSNEVLKESLVAAVTNQGTPLAIETLYKFAVESKDTDGFYSKGTGLGEAVPNPEAFPYLKEMAEKRDDYSHLAVKALLNAGSEGVKAVFDVLRTSRDPEADKKLIANAIDHVNFEEETEALVKQEAEKGTNPQSVQFARDILKNFQEENAQLEREAKEESEASGNASMMDDTGDGEEE